VVHFEEVEVVGGQRGGGEEGEEGERKWEKMEKDDKEKIGVEKGNGAIEG
jgi:hypothetical protein